MKDMMHGTRDGLSAEAWSRIEAQRRMDEQFGPSGVDPVAEERARAAREKLGDELWKPDANVVISPGEEDSLALGGCLPRVRRSWRCWTWHHAIAESDLPMGARAVLWAVAGMMRGDARPIVRTVDVIAGRAGAKSKRTVQKHARTAAQRGFLRVVQRADADGCSRAPVWVPGIPEDMAERFASRLEADGQEDDE